MTACPMCEVPNNPGAETCTGCGFMLSAPSTSLASGTVIDGRYRIDKEIGSGGFGVTYRGFDQKLKRLVAVKEMFPSGSSRRGDTVIPSRQEQGKWLAHIETFKKECQTLITLEGRALPGLLRVHDVCEANQTVYMVMELLAGQSLEQLITSAPNHRLDETLVVEYAHQLCRTLEVLHEDAHVLHRDIKPPNIMIEGTQRGAVLIDFGAARAYTMQTVMLTAIVSEGFSPLEQWASRGKGRFGPYTDIYALGATLYFAAVGEVPPSAPDRVTGVPLLPPIQVNPRLSPGFSNAVMRAMEIHQADRPPTAREFLSLLETPSPARPQAAVAALVPAAQPAPSPPGKFQPPAPVALQILQAAGSPIQQPPPPQQPKFPGLPGRGGRGGMGFPPALQPKSLSTGVKDRMKRWMKRHRVRSAILMIVIGIWIISAIGSLTQKHNGSSTLNSLGAAMTQEVAAPVLAALRSCAQSAVLSPANCPQQVSAVGASSVVWHLYGNPLSGAEVTRSGNSYTVFGVAAMTVSYSLDNNPQLDEETVTYEAKVSASGKTATVTSLGQQNDTPPSAIDVPRPPLTNAQLENAVSSAWATCVASTLSSPPLYCPANDVSAHGSGVVSGKWVQNANPLLNSSITYDNTSGLLHVVGSYSLTFTYASYGNAERDPFSGNYDAQIADDNGQAVVLTMVPND